MMRQRQLFCMLLGISVLFREEAVATYSSCDKANDDEVVSCVLDSSSSNRCSADIAVRNRTSEPLCGDIKDYRSLTEENEENYELLVTAYRKTFPGYFIHAAGVNVSLVVKNKETKGFMVRFKVKDYVRCRYIDLTNATNFKHSLTVSYDCMFFRAEETGYPFSLTVTELPSRLFRRLTCKVPDLTNLKPETIADWKSLICVESFYGERASVYVRFQTASYRFGNVSYSVRLYKDDTIVENQTISAVGQFHSVKFFNLLPGNYSVKLNPLHPDCNSKCLTTISWPFEIFEKEEDSNGFSPIHATLIAGLILLLCVLLVVSLLRSRIKPPIIGSTVYIVYVYHRESNFNVVKEFANLLRSLNFRVLLDEWQVQGHNPVDWVKDCVNQADFVLIVWTKAAIMRYNKKETEADEFHEPNYLTSHLFKFILHRIDCRVNNSCNGKNQHSTDSVCNICWNTSTKQLIPDRFNSYRTFVMPNRFSRLLHYLHHYSSPRNLPCEACLPKVPGENLKATEEGRAFLTVLNHYQSEAPLFSEPEVPMLSGHGRPTAFGDTANSCQPPLGNLDAAAGVPQLPNESLADQGYESLTTDNTNVSIQTANPSMSLPGSEKVEVQPTSLCDLDPYFDDSDSERELEYLRRKLA